MKSVLAFLDGYKRVLVILSFLGAALIERATGTDYSSYLTAAFGALGWGDPAGAGATTASIAATAAVLWAVIDGVQKARATKSGARDIKRLTLALLAGALVAPTAHADMRLSVLGGGQVAVTAVDSEAATAATPTVSLWIEADTAESEHAPELVVLADLTALPGESLDVQDPETFRAIELSVGLSQPLGQSLRFQLYAEAGFATRLPGDVEPRDRSARWASAGLRFSGPRAWLQVGVGPDQRPGISSAALERAAFTGVRATSYQASVTVRGAVDLVGVGERGRVVLVGAAVLGLDLSYRWAALDGGRTDVIRLGVAVGI